MNPISSAELICKLYESDPTRLQEHVDRNKGDYINVDNIHRWFFPDLSILIIDEEGVASFVVIENTLAIAEQEPVVTQPKKSWFKKPAFLAAAIGGGLFLTGAAVAGVVYYHKH